MRTILFLLQKETLQVLRDRVMLVQIFAPLVIQLLVMSQAMTFEVQKTDLALVDLDRTPASERLVEGFTASGRFPVVLATASGSSADRALLERRVGAILTIPRGYARNLVRGASPTVQLVLNAEDGAAAGVVRGYAGEIVARVSAAETRARPRLTLRSRTLYNPRREYLAYMGIGLLASLVTLTGILLASQNVAREKEIGTLEQLNVTPITRGQFIAGKLLPFWLLGLVQLTVGLLILHLGFGVDLGDGLGSLGLVYLGAMVYLLAALGLGLLVSTAVATQQQAQFVTFFVVVTFFFLGGIFTPVQSMPPWAQTVADANPIRHFVHLLRTVLMKGGDLGDIASSLGAMALFAALALGLAVVRVRKTVG